MTPRELYAFIDRAAPFSLSAEECERYGHYDNSGLLLDCGEEIGRALFSLDLSGAAVARAGETGANCIVTHHPAIFGLLKSLSFEEGRNVLACARAGISVISAHLNLDCARGGIDEKLMEGLGGKRPAAVMEELAGGGYGRVYDVEPCTAEEFVRRAKETFSAKRILRYGDRPVGRVASFCGSGFGEGAISFALSQGADTIVSSDPKHHLILEGVERGLNLVFLTHYCAEHYGFKAFYESLSKELPMECSFLTDERFL